MLGAQNMLDFVLTRLNGIIRDKKGISAMEYAILAAAIIGVVATAASTIGTDLGVLLNKVIDALVNAAG